MKIEKGKLKAAENLTPAKRYSFLVGKDEPCHTAIERLRKFIIDAESAPSLDDLEEIFSVERVTNEFFNLYCEKYHQLREHLESNEDFVVEAEKHNYTSVQFAKKLMGQIVFLYFLQKKGWLGVNVFPETLNKKEYNAAFYAKGTKSKKLMPIFYQLGENNLYHRNRNVIKAISDEEEAILAQCIKGKSWGSGPQNFMRKLFETAAKRGARQGTMVNFFDDYLEPLFYNALNVNRGEQGYYPTLHCRIPFLSGGLFEPIDGYDWEHNDFNIPNEIFSNMQTNGTRDSDGILDIFDRYNFTMSEDEPLEKEVAIDPEMLGKVFENLLEVNDRKSKGAFYTPREIVHYMCQESLIAYLSNKVNASEQSIRDFILYGDFMKDEDTVKEKRQGNGGMLISEELYKINSKGRVEVNKLIAIDNALKSVRVADPAVGSGAFPLGMLNEIVKARDNVSAYISINKNAKEKWDMYTLDRSMYEMKKETIKNSIFAADIEPSAVDISRLRLWLSLVIDDEIDPNTDDTLHANRQPHTLPNLECNILCGNSLIDEFKGTKLINESELLNNIDNDQTNLFQGEFRRLIKELIELQNELFKCEDKNKKGEINEKIYALKDSIVKSHMRWNTKQEIFNLYKKTHRMSSKPFVIWHLEFARVFKEKGGFDIIIGNPPYIQLQKSISETNDIKLGDLYINQKFETFEKTGDIYCLFYEKGWQLLNKGGILSFITSNKWMRSGYGKSLRNFLAKNTNPLQLIDFAGQKIFESATVDVNILIFEKNKNKQRTLACKAKENCRNNLSVFVQRNNTFSNLNSSDSWVVLSEIEQRIKNKIEAKGTPLMDWNINIYRGVLTGYNEAFIISGSKKDELIAADPKSAELIRPILRGRDIKRYSYSYADLYLICTFPSKHYDIDRFPAIKKHLLMFGKERLQQTGERNIINGETIQSRKKTKNKWFETQDSIDYWDDFYKPKIIFQEMVKSPNFYLDINRNFICLDTSRIITGDHLEYLLGLLNSKLFFFAIKYYYGGGGLGKSGVRMKHTFFEKFYAYVPTIDEENWFKRINYNQLSNNDMLKIDEFFYNKYNLTRKEILFIEKSYLV